MVERRKLRADGAPPRKNTKCTPKLTKQFCRLIERGLPADGACDYLGITSSAFWDWIRKGEKWLNGEHLSEYEPYGAFVQAFRRATAEYKLQRLDNMHGKGNSLWVRELAILERRDRSSFGKNEPLGGGDDAYDPDERFL